MSKRPMMVAGIMSGTSADGINVALVEIAERPSIKSSAHGQRSQPSIRLLGHQEFPYTPKIRAAVLSTMNAHAASVADLARLNFLLGELYAEAVLAAQRKFRTKVDLVGCHGQTIYHQGDTRLFLGKKIAATWQTGEAAVIATRVGVPVISDFRPADMAVGGKGAPLVPYLDYLWFRDPRIGRIVQNIGGITNLTAIPAAATPEKLLAFDTGPGNMVIDALTQRLFRKPFDRDGSIAASGTVIDVVLTRLLREPFFQSKPPKTAGREEFGREFVERFLQLCGSRRKHDVLATATALTVASVADAIKRFVNAKSRRSFGELILSGGGAKNSTLVGMLAERLAPLGMVLRFSDEFGLPSQAKEAVAFAVLAYESWNRRPSNVPAATGARRPAVLGKISYP